MLQEGMTRIEKEEFGKAVLQAIYDLDAIAITPNSALLGILTEIDELDDLNNLETMESRRAHFQIPNTTADDYSERFFEIKPGCRMLAGIRHLSGKKDQPFVHMFLGFIPTSDDLPRLKELALKQFGVFFPKQVSFWLRPSSLLALDLETKGYAARRYIVGRFSKISKRPLPFGYERITLEKMHGAPDSGGWYEKAYSDFHSEYPELERWVPITDSKELQRCADDKLLFRVLVDGNHAGLIGGRNEPLLGSPAVYMTELLLTHPFKGQGFAAALQRKFLDSMAPKFELVWGTIDAKNKPSTRTALKIGRAAIRAEFFLPIG